MIRARLVLPLLLAPCAGIVPAGEPTDQAQPPKPTALAIPSSATHAIRQLVAQLAEEAPEANQTLATWHWGDDALPEPVRRAFRDDLEVGLIRSRRFRYYNRERFRQILREHRLTLAQLADPEAMKAVAAAGIDSFLSVEILDTSADEPDGLDTHTVLLAKLTDARSAAVVWAAIIEGVNPKGVPRLFEGKPPKSGTSRYRELAAAIAKGLQAGLPEDLGVQTITLSSPPKEGEAGVGIGIDNPLNAPFDRAAFERELLVALVRTGAFSYVDPAHVNRLVAQWRSDSEAVAEKNKQALAQTFAIDGYLFGVIRAGTERSTQLSMRLVSLKDGEEAWAGKFAGTDTHHRIEPREIPEAPVPRQEPAPPEELTLEDIEQPLKPPIPRPELRPRPDMPHPRKHFSLLGTLLYPAIGLPRDAVDAAFLVADRVPLAGAATSTVYRYGGIAFLCRFGTDRELQRDVTTSRALTWGQLRSRDHYPTRWPLVQSARAHPRGLSSYLLQMSLFTLTVGDAVDALYTAVDRTPLVGTVTTPLLLPLDYAWRLLPDDRDIYTAQITPGRAQCRLTFGSIAADQRWSLLPNIRSWPFRRASRRAQKEALAKFLEKDQQVTEENESRLNQWRTAEQERKRHNQDALATLRKRNLDARRKYEQELARIRRDNQRDQSTYQREKEAAIEHNRRAARVNGFTSHIFDIDRALNPPPVPQPQPKAEPEPKPEPEPKAKPKEEPKPEPKAEPKAKPEPAPKAKAKPAPKAEPKPAPKKAPAPADDPEA